MYKLMYIGIKILNNLCTNLCCTTTKKQNTQSLFDGFWYSLDINAMSVNGEIHNAYNLNNTKNIVTIVTMGKFTESIEQRENRSAEETLKAAYYKKTLV